MTSINFLFFLKKSFKPIKIQCIFLHQLYSLLFNKLFKNITSLKAIDFQLQTSLNFVDIMISIEIFFKRNFYLFTHDSRNKIKKQQKHKNVQKQFSRGITMKKCSEYLQQRYRRTPMLECGLNKCASKQFQLEIL